MMARIIRRLFGAARRPRNERGWNEDWRIGDLAYCIADNWICRSPSNPRADRIYRVLGLVEGVTTDGTCVISALVLAGCSDGAYHCLYFRKVRPEVKAADAAFTARIRRRKPVPA